MSTTKVTVLMPVYNGEVYLCEAIESILRQTFPEFELLIIDDGSKDKSCDIISSYSDPRIRLVRNGINLGLIATLNRGLTLAKGEYVARMDCDDLSAPVRLEKQLAFMDAHPEVGILGSWCRSIGEGKGKIFRYPEAKEEVRCSLLFDSPLAHPSVMMRRQQMIEHGLFYNSQYPHAEDYDLWARASAVFDLAVVKDILLLYRVHDAQVTQVYSEQQVVNADRVRHRLLQKLGVAPDVREFAVHKAMSMPSKAFDGFSFAEADDWACKILHANRVRQLFPEPQFSKVVLERLFTLAKKQQPGVQWARDMVTAKLLREGSNAGRNLLTFLVRQGINRIGA